MKAGARGIASFFRETLCGDPLWRLGLLFALGTLTVTKMHLPDSYYFLRVYYPDDDAFYYTKIATEFWRHGFPTFDGLTHTNGYQPLWMLMAILAAAPLALAGAAHVMPFVLGLVNAAVILYSGQIMFSLARREGFRPAAALFCIALALGLPMYPYLFNLMESAVTVLTVCLLLFYLQDTLQKNAIPRPGPLAGLSFLVLMSRLDMGVFLLMIYATLLLWFPARRIFLAGILLCIFTAPYFAYNLWLNGDPMPISGMVKSEWSRIAEFEADGREAASLRDYWQSNLTWEQRLVDTRNGVAEPVSLFLSRLTFGWWQWWNFGYRISAAVFISLLLVWLAAVIGGTALGLGLHWRRRGQSWRMLGISLLLLLAFYGFQMLYYPFFSHVIYPWYLGLGLATLLFCFGAPVAAALSRIPAGNASALPCALVFFILAVDITAFKRDRAFFHDFYMPQHGLQDAALWLRDNTAQDARVAAWTAGKLGQFSGRSVVNLEGLVADREVLESFNAFDPAGYIAAHGINYVANHYPDFTEGLGVPGPFRPRWVRIGAYEPSLATLWETLTLPGLTRGDEFTRWGWNVFWAHRYRVIWDYPESFTAVFKRRAMGTAAFVFEVNQPLLNESLETRRKLADAVAAVARMQEAETAVSGEEVRAVLYLPRSSRYAISGNLVTTALTTPAPGMYQFYALVRPGVNGLSISGTLAHHEVRSAVPPERALGWAIVPLLASAQPFDRAPLPVTIRGLAGTFDPKTRIETASYIDCFYSVKQENDAQFRDAARQLLTWMNRSPRVPHDPDPNPPRVPVDF